MYVYIKNIGGIMVSGKVGGFDLPMEILKKIKWKGDKKNDNNCMLNFLDRMRVLLFTLSTGCTCVCVSSASHFTDDIDMTYWSRLMT